MMGYLELKQYPEEENAFDKITFLFYLETFQHLET